MVNPGGIDVWEEEMLKHKQKMRSIDINEKKELSDTAASGDHQMSMVRDLNSRWENLMPHAFFSTSNT